MSKVTFFTRQGCELCAKAEPLVVRRAGRLGFVLEMVDIDDAGLTEAYGERVPVVLLDGREVLAGRFGSREVRRALR